MACGSAQETCPGPRPPLTPSAVPPSDSLRPTQDRMVPQTLPAPEPLTEAQLITLITKETGQKVPPLSRDPAHPLDPRLLISSSPVTPPPNLFVFSTPPTSTPPDTGVAGRWTGPSPPPSFPQDRAGCQGEYACQTSSASVYSSYPRILPAQPVNRQSGTCHVIHPPPPPTHPHPLSTISAG